LIERRRIQFTGRVQGVGFRATARGIASGYTVTGWVRNEADGSVVAEVQGEGSEIEAFLEELNREMGRNIRRAISETCPAENAEARFEVRR
jgi:acylphosphatase